MKTLKQVLSTVNYVAPNKSLDDFVKKHEVEKVEDANGNKDDVFQGANVKYVKRKTERHGYDKPEDEKVHESVKEDSNITEKKLTKAEMNKREEVAQAMERDQPGMPMSKKMAIATATAKEVAEGVEDRHADAYDDFNRHIKKVVNKDTRDSLKKNFSRAMRGFSRHYERDDGGEGMYDHVERMEGLAKEAEHHASIKEEVEQLTEGEETTLEEDLIDFYFTLNEDAREEFISILELEDDEMLLEYMEALEE